MDGNILRMDLEDVYKRQVLRAKLYDLEQQKRHDEEAELRRSQVGTGDRSEKIRTYNFPQGRVTDVYKRQILRNFRTRSY